MSTNRSKRKTVARSATGSSAKRASKGATPRSAEDPEKDVYSQMYSITEQWQSDMKFFFDELSFFKNLIDKYFFLNLLAEKDIARTQKAADELVKLDNQQTALGQMLGEHNRHLISLAENPFSHSSQQCKDEHARLESEIADFVKNFRSVKKNIFRLAETAINSQKSAHLLNG